MPKEFGRNSRVAQFIKEELAILIQRAFPLNEYGMITVTKVDVSADLRNATVYITTLMHHIPDSSDPEQPSIAASCPQTNQRRIAELNEKIGYFRHELSHMLRCKGIPVLRFKYDDAIERGQRLTELINAVRHTDVQ